MIERLAQEFAGERYLADEGLLTAVHLALTLGRPLILEGEPGVGKTEVGKVLAGVLGAELIRLQCYEGIDASQALYDWDYSRQLLYALSWKPVYQCTCSHLALSSWTASR